MQEKIKSFVEASPFQNTIIALIIINAIILGMETSQSIMAQYGMLLKAVDAIILKVLLLRSGLEFMLMVCGFSPVPGACLTYLS